MLRTRSLLGLATSLLLTTAGVAITATPAHAADGTITGTISAANRTVGAGTLTIRQWDGTNWVVRKEIEFTRTQAKTYSVPAAPGTYRADFESNWSFMSSGLFPTYYGDGVWDTPTSPAAGTPGTFVVPDGGTVTKNIAYPVMRELSGTVTSGGVPEDTAYLQLGRWDAATSKFVGAPFYSSADTKGRYLVPSVAEGIYVMVLYRESPTTGKNETKVVGEAPDKLPVGPAAPGVFTLGGADQVRNYEWDGLNPAPTPITAPSIPATGKVGTALTVTTGTWTETPTFSYQWNRDGVAIPGATGTSYTPVAADAGKALTVAVGATQALNKPGSATTDAVEIAKISAKVSAKKKVKKHKLKLTVGVEGLSGTGKVKVFLGKKVVGKGRVSNGKATIKLKPAVRLGKVKLKVVYSGNDAFVGSTKKIKVKVIS